MTLKIPNLTLSKFNKIMDWVLNPVPYFKKEKNINNEKCFAEKKREAEKTEKEWGCDMIGKRTGNWTTILSEDFTKIVLTLLGHKNITKPKKKDKLKPDWETSDFMVEVKCETWCVGGTAGEKVIAVPMKYRNVPKLYGKPLKIILLAYTEYDFTHGNTPVFGKRDVLLEEDLQKWKSRGIEFVKMSDLIKQLKEKVSDDEIENFLKKRMSEQREGERMNAEERKIKPFVKWVGGKSKLIDTIATKFPREMNNYREPFLGGGSVLLKILQMKQDGVINIKGNAYAYDENKILIQLYKQIQNNLEYLCNRYNELVKEYRNIENLSIRNEVRVENKDGNKKKGKKEKANVNPNETEKLQSKENYYYYIRNTYNSMSGECVDKPAYFLFLNKTGFRGMYRECKNGFNIPFGNYKTPPEVLETQLQKIKELIKDVKFESCDFTKSLSSIEENDYIYLDPPYYPVNENSFVQYNKSGFSEKQHMELFDMINNFHDSVKWTLSNFNTDKVIDRFQKYNIECITVRHTINSIDPSKKAKEVLIYN